MGDDFGKFLEQWDEYLRGERLYEDVDAFPSTSSTGGHAKIPRYAWSEGVRDSIRIVKSRRENLLAICDGDACRPHPAALAIFDEICWFLEMMLERGEYKSRTPIE